VQFCNGVRRQSPSGPQWGPQWGLRAELWSGGPEAQKLFTSRASKWVAKFALLSRMYTTTRHLYTKIAEMLIKNEVLLNSPPQKHYSIFIMMMKGLGKRPLKLNDDHSRWLLKTSAQFPSSFFPFPSYTPPCLPSFILTPSLGSLSHG